MHPSTRYALYPQKSKISYTIILRMGIALVNMVPLVASYPSKHVTFPFSTPTTQRWHPPLLVLYCFLLHAAADLAAVILTRSCELTSCRPPRKNSSKNVSWFEAYLELQYLVTCLVVVAWSVCDSEGLEALRMASKSDLFEYETWPSVGGA